MAAATEEVVMIGYDTETHLLLPGRLVPRMVCLTICDGVEQALLVGREAIAAIPQVLSKPAVAHNAAFDLAVMCEAHRLATGTDEAIRLAFEGLREGRLQCTMVREKLIRIARDETEYHMGTDGKMARTVFTLAACVKRHFGAEIGGKEGDDVWRLRYHELDGVPVEEWPQAAKDYALDDATWCRQLYEAQEQASQDAAATQGISLRPDGSWPGAARESLNHFALHLLSAWGQRTDPDTVAATVAEWTEAAERGKDVGRAGGWVRPNGTTDTKALKRRVAEAYHTLGKPAPVTPKGNVRYSEEVLADSGDPELVEYSKSLHFKNWSAKYIAPLQDGTWRPVTPRYDVLKTTGRTGCSKPPQQQPPREGTYRECWVPRKGWVYVGADYDAIELGALAQVCLWQGLGDSLARTLQEGRDPHLVTGLEILRREDPARWGTTTYEQALALYKSGDADVVNARQLAKIANFGFPGGMQGPSFVALAKGYGVTLTQEQAADLRAAWLAAYPEMHGYFKWCDGLLGFDGTTTVSQFVSGRVRGGVRRTVLYNTWFQGLVADGAKLALSYLSEEAYTQPDSAFYGCRPVVFLHDEIIAEAPLHRAHEAAERMAQVMRDVMQRHIPDIPIGCEPVLMDCWRKGAKTTRDASGRLIIWRP